MPSNAQPSIVWTDAQGGAVLIQTVAPYLNNWSPVAIDIDDYGAALADASIASIIYRTDYNAAFILQPVPMAAQTLFMRLQLWLGRGGQVTVNTNDNASRVYQATVWVDAGKRKLPTMTLDQETFEYTIQLYLRNVANAPFVAIYPDGVGGGTIPGFPSIVVAPGNAALTFP